MIQGDEDDTAYYESAALGPASGGMMTLLETVEGLVSLRYHEKISNCIPNKYLESIQ